jgi:lipid A 4'-phosphatase
MHASIRTPARLRVVCTRTAAASTLTLALVALFAFVPEIDLEVGRALGDGSRGFLLAHDVRLYVLNRTVTWIGRIGVAVLLLGTLLAWLVAAPRLPALRWLRERRRALLYLVAVAAIGPGLIVNALLKDHGGRARPVQVAEFGGSKRFTPPFEVADQCARNCAFVSGHAAAAAFPLTGFFLARSRRARRAWLAAGVASGVTIGFARMLTGSHFLSDVIFSMLIVYWVAALCAAWLLPERAADAPR